MTVVLDANLVVVLASKDSRAGAVERRLHSWLEAGEELSAPALLPYEVASGLVRLSSGGRLPADQLEAAWGLAQQLPIQLHPMASGLEVIRVALRLGRASAYDAAYIALAQELGANLWTLDGPLAREAAGVGYPVRLVE
jgi:predicted nucleic acid-binding protein